ncbi:MAG: nuclease-related domain-containing protein, partial [Gammaproteobacteria bacterium]
MDASILVPAGAALLPMLLIFALIEAVRYAEGLRRTRSPFNRDFLRPAGFSLQRRLEELQLELALSFGFGLFVPLWFYSMWLSVQNWNPDAATTSLLVLFAVAGGGGFLVLLLRTFRNYRGLRLLRMGLDGELATGQELDRLMRHGCRIFHDVPAGPGNIDHVVVGPAG